MMKGACAPRWAIADFQTAYLKEFQENLFPGVRTIRTDFCKRSAVYFRMKKRLQRILSRFLLCCLTTCCLTVCGLTACVSSEDASWQDTVFLGMDTYITLRLPRSGITDTRMEELAADCRDIVEHYEGILSCHDTQSEVYALNNNAQMLLDADEALLSVWQTAVQISALTDGAYDPTLGTLTSLWNVNGGGPVPPAAAVAEALRHTGVDYFTADGAMFVKNDAQAQLDLGGIAKGYALQEILTYLSSTEVSYGIVSMGGNIGVYGTKPDKTPYKIGIKNPLDTSSTIGYLSIGSGFISVSGSYERYFIENGQTYHHILDPETGYPADSGLLSVVVYTQNGAAADALSTALFVMGKDDGIALYNSGKVAFEAVFITTDNEIFLTNGLRESGTFALTVNDYTLVE